MSTVDNLVQANSKDELVAMAAEYELDTDGTKAELAERILKFEAGVPQETEVTEPEPVEEPVSDGPTTLVKFKGKSKWYEAGGVRFSSDKPFQVVPEDVADKLFDSYPELFVPASRKQVEEFYS